jgi:phosphopentomutase
MIKRVILLVVEGLGVGATDDASTYGDTSCHTLAHLAESAGGLSLPTLESLGLAIGKLPDVFPRKRVERFQTAIRPRPSRP